MPPDTPDGKTMLASAAFLSLCAIVLMVLGGWRRWVGIATLLFVLVCAILYLLRRYRKKDADAPEAVLPATTTPSPVWPTSAPAVPETPAPPLSAHGRAEAEKWLDKLHQAGILVPGLCCKDWRQSEVGCRSAPIRRLLRNGG